MQATSKATCELKTNSLLGAKDPSALSVRAFWDQIKLNAEMTRELSYKVNYWIEKTGTYTRKNNTEVRIKPTALRSLWKLWGAWTEHKLGWWSEGLMLTIRKKYTNLRGRLICITGFHMWQNSFQTSSLLSFCTGFTRFAEKPVSPFSHSGGRCGRQPLRGGHTHWPGSPEVLRANNPPERGSRVWGYQHGLQWLFDLWSQNTLWGCAKVWTEDNSFLQDTRQALRCNMQDTVSLPSWTGNSVCAEHDSG